MGLGQRTKESSEKWDWDRELKSKAEQGDKGREVKSKA